MDCSSAPRKPLCASDGRTFASRCEFQRAKCRDPQLEVMRGSCKGQSSPACLNNIDIDRREERKLICIGRMVINGELLASPPMLDI